LLRLDIALARSALQATEAATAQAREELADARRRLADAERLASRSSIAATQVRALQSEVSIDATTVKLREAEQRAEAERLERHRVRAPFAGVIGQKLTEAGEWVAPGDAVFELIADRGLRVDFRVPQAYFPRIARDTPVALRFDAHDGRTVAGRIGEIVPVSDADARTFLVRVYPQADDLSLTPGMSASGTLRLRTGERGIAIPRDALLRHPDGRVTVWVVDGEAAAATVAERVVTTGLAFDGHVVVTDGLTPGATIVVEGNEALRPGQRISIHSRR
jgi:RND family efflux transporter MFP subunit